MQMGGQVEETMQMGGQVEEGEKQRLIYAWTGLEQVGTFYCVHKC